MAGALMAAPLSAATLPETFESEFAPLVLHDKGVSLLDAPGLSALARIPADAESYVLITRPAKLVKLYAELQEEKLDAIQSVAVASGKGSAEQLARVALIVNLLQDASNLGFYDMWEMNAQDPAFIRAAKEKALNELNERATALINETHLAPIYAVLSVQAGKEQVLNEMYAELNKNFKEKLDEKYEAVTINGLEGYKIQLTPPDCGGNGKFDFIKGLKDRTFYLLSKVQGNDIIVVLCENPEEIALADSPEKSVLTTDKMKEAELHLPTLAASAWMSTEYASALVLCSNSSYSALASTVSRTFTQLAEMDAPNQAVYTAAAAAAQRMSEWKIMDYKPNTMPLSLTVWLSAGDDLLMEAKGDSLGMKFNTGKLLSADLATAEDTVFYVESAGGNTPEPTLWQEGMLDDLMSVAKGMVLFQDEEEKDSDSASLQQVELVLPEIKQLVSNLRKLDSLLTYPGMFVIATPDTTQKSMMGESLPRMAVAFSVKDRAALSSVWDDSLAAVRSIMVKNGTPESAADITLASLPILARKLPNGATSYMVFNPMISMVGLEPQLVLTDDAFVLGTQTSYAANLVTARSGNGVPFNGTVISFQFPQLARCFAGKFGDDDVLAKIANTLRGVYIVSTQKGNEAIMRAKVVRQPKAQ